MYITVKDKYMKLYIYLILDILFVTELSLPIQGIIYKLSLSKLLWWQAADYTI